MKIRHKICGNLTKKEVDYLKKFNLEFKIGEVDCHFLDEDEQYFKVQNVLKQFDLIDFRYPEFEKKEVTDSQYSIINGRSLSGGYPMPDNLEYQILTYDTKNWCKSCGVGLIQNSSFRLKKEPNIKKKIFGIYWQDDVLFVEKEYFLEIFKPLGLECRDVMLYKGDKIIENIVQIVIPTAIDELNLSEYEYEVCNSCSTKKYSPMPLGFFTIHKKPLPHIFLSKEYFGSGYSANKKIFISKELRNKLIKDKNMLWDWFVPCE